MKNLVIRENLCPFWCTAFFTNTKMSISDTNLDALLNRVENLVTEREILVDSVTEQEVTNYTLELEKEEKEHPLYQKLKENKNLRTLTNFGVGTIDHISAYSEPYFLDSNRRGPKPKISNKDSLVLLLIYYKCNMTFEALAALLNFKLSTLKKAIDRMRPVLLFALQDMWREKNRPKEYPNTAYSHAALLVDCTSVEIYKPTGTFREVRKYWDTKNGIYSLKKQVLVSAQVPHIAMFISKFYVGSTHDFKIFKETYKNLEPYLLKSPIEKESLVGDEISTHWSVVGDKAYYADQSITAPIRRIAVKKGKRLSTREKQENSVISNIRCPVEQFFGRLKKLWYICDKYRHSSELFDIDFDNCVLLTNIHISSNNLTNGDGEYYRRLLVARKKEKDEILEKRKRQK